MASDEASTSNCSIDCEAARAVQEREIEEKREQDEPVLTFELISQFLLNNPEVLKSVEPEPEERKDPPKKKPKRGLGDTINILKRRQEEDLRSSPESSCSTRSTPGLASGVNQSIFPLHATPIYGMESLPLGRLNHFVSQEDEREIKNRIKALTNQMPVQRTIDEEKSFSCLQCGKKFGNKFLLNKHMFIHTGLRPHQCPECRKAFNRKDNLLRHRKTHVQMAKGLGNGLPIVPHKMEINNATSAESLLLSFFPSSQ